MKRVLSFVAVLAAIVHAWPAKTALAADGTNYSGRYTAERPKKTSGGSAESTLEVVHNADAIEITLVESGKKTTSRCPLNGSEGDYTSPGGIPGKCKAQLNAKNLIVESVVVTRPQPTANVRMHTKERWELSKDGKTLTIRSDVDFPDFPASISAAMAGDTSTTRKYTRMGNP
jgi:hypothetical protein